MRLGQYELLLRLGSGGAANVFLARDTDATGGRLVALKVLLPELTADRETLAMFFAEARIASRLDHPNIAGIHGFGRNQGIHCLVMELVFGQSFGEILGESARAQRPLTVGVILTIIAKVLAGLHYAHELKDAGGKPMNVVHRDVTAQNILVSYDGIPKLSDFGIAKAVDRGFETRIGVVKGKFAYMSPEQTLGKVLDRRTDIFCAGIVLWEALTGEVLFDAPSPIDAMTAVRQRPIRPPSQVAIGLSPLVDPIVMRALRRSPAERYQTAAEMHRDIEALIDSSGVRIDAHTIASEIAGIYGPIIAERAFALRAAMDGSVPDKVLAKALGGEPLSDAQLPYIPGGTTDPDPLGLFLPSTRKPRRPIRAVAARPERAFSAVERPATDPDFTEMNTLSGLTTEEDLIHLRGLQEDFDAPVNQDAALEAWDAVAPTVDSAHDLLDLLSAEDVQDKKVSERFASRFGGALVDDLVLNAAPEGDEMQTIRELPFVLGGAPEPQIITQPSFAAEEPRPPHATAGSRATGATEPSRPADPSTDELAMQFQAQPSAASPARGPARRAEFADDGPTMAHKIDPPAGVRISSTMFVLLALAFMAAGACIVLALTYL